MDNKQICPLMAIAKQSLDDACCRECDCAWFNGECCAVLNMSDSLEDITFRLEKDDE